MVLISIISYYFNSVSDMCDIICSLGFDYVAVNAATY